MAQMGAPGLRGLLRQIPPPPAPGTALGFQESLEPVREPLPVPEAGEDASGLLDVLLGQNEPLREEPALGIAEAARPARPARPMDYSLAGISGVDINAQADAAADARAGFAPGGGAVSAGFGVGAPDPIRGAGQIVRLASTQVGSPYVWADQDPIGPAGGPGTGFDCSGLTRWVLGKMGVEVPHLASAQAAMFPKVGQAQLQPGDLIFYQYGRKGYGGPEAVDHVAIYAGNGRQVAASSSQSQVAIQPVDWNHFVWGGRVTGANRPGRTGPTPSATPRPTPRPGAMTPQERAVRARPSLPAMTPAVRAYQRRQQR